MSNNKFSYHPLKQSIKDLTFPVIKHHWVFLLFLFSMSIYYGIRMFSLDPWYDELYTYYSFISKGPIYSAIHWPVPNNHVMYSIVSAFLNVFGNPYISLRGISYLSCLLNLFLLYILSNKFLDRFLSLGCVALYSSFYLVNSLSIQGRGYSMSITFYLLSLLMLYEISVNKKNRLIYYIVFSLTLTWGLYTVTSNLYWVIPTCLTGGLYLLLKKDYLRLIKLVISSIIAAIHTFGLYTIIWLAIGSNLLSKTPDSGFYGIYQVKIILSAPWKSFITGMNYMLSSPYIQSMDRSIVIHEFFPWLRGLMNQFIVNQGSFLVGLLLLVLCFNLVITLYKIIVQKIVPFFPLYSIIILVILPLILIVQSVQPYHRVFTFLGIVLAITFFLVFSLFKIQRLNLFICLFFIIFSFVNLNSSYYRAPYADRENKIKEILQTSEITQDMENICFIDDYQKYVLHFYYNIRPIEVPLEDANYLLVPKEILEAEYTLKSWPILYTHSEITPVISEEYKIISETEDYIFYYKN